MFVIKIYVSAFSRLPSFGPEGLDLGRPVAPLLVAPLLVAPLRLPS
jgi:hypothetical protein